MPLISQTPLDLLLYTTPKRANPSIASKRLEVLANRRVCVNDKLHPFPHHHLMQQSPSGNGDFQLHKLKIMNILAQYIYMGYELQEVIPL